MSEQALTVMPQAAVDVAQHPPLSVSSPRRLVARRASLHCASLGTGDSLADFKLLDIVQSLSYRIHRL